MTAEQIEIATALGTARFAPATFDKRFSKNLASLAKSEPSKEICIEKEAEFWINKLKINQI